MIITMQPPATSAVYRELHPEEYDQSGTTARLDGLTQRVEMLAVILAQSQMLNGNQNPNLRIADLPSKFADLLDDGKPLQQSDDDLLAAIAEFDRRMGG